MGFSPLVVSLSLSPARSFCPFEFWFRRCDDGVQTREWRKKEKEKKEREWKNLKKKKKKKSADNGGRRRTAAVAGDAACSYRWWLDDGWMVVRKKNKVGEIAHALEKSGAHFVWSLRQPSSKTKFEAPKDYVDISNILPEGFLDRTTSIGKVIGWAPQAEILAHPATGGFISHCGWNSTMESLWYGVPMITWPMYAEQQFNAFEMVVELGLAVDIVLDYRMENPRIVSAKEIESGIRKLMEDDGKIRKKVQAKSEESRKSVMKGGSSFISAGKFIDDVLNNSSGGGN